MVDIEFFDTRQLLNECITVLSFIFRSRDIPTEGLGGVTVRASDLRSSGRGFDSQSGRYQAT